MAIAVSSSGRTFRALAAYLALGRSGAAPERVAWSSARNLPTDDPQLAARFMRATAAQNVRVAQPVYHLAIAFDRHDGVDRATIERVAHRVLDRLGLAEYEAILVAHRDRGHPHVHVLVNRVHPVTGRAWDRWQDQAVIQQVLREEERALGIREVQGRLTDSPGFPRPASPDVVPSDRAPRVASDARASDRSSAGPAGESSGDVGRSSLYERARVAAPVLRAATSWGELESELASRGMRLERAGQGLVVTDGQSFVKASRVARELGMGQLEARFGAARAELDRRDPIAAIKQQLSTYEQIGARIAEQFAAGRALSAAHARVAQFDANDARARVADGRFAESLARVYQSPAAARAAFDAHAREHGIERAAQVLVDAPERLGPLLTVEQHRAFGLRRVADDTRAREAARGAGVYGRDAWLARDRVALPAVAHAAREAIPSAVEHDRTVRETLRQMPTRGVLEREIGRAVRRLLPHELEELRRALTAPQFALVSRLGRAVRDALLDRDGRDA